MSARRHLNPDQFRLVHETDSNVHSVDAFHPDFGAGKVPVGSLLWDKQSGRITNIGVQQGFRRQGIGRKMFEHAQQFHPAPLHSETQTNLGKK